MKCPVCNSKIQNDDQRLCERCGWEFDRYVTELSAREREVYDRKLGLSRQNWKELLQARKDAERLKKEVARLKKELEQVWQEANEADTRAEKLSGQARVLRARIKELEKELRSQRKKAQKDADRINRLVDESRRLQSSLTELEDELEQERANARQAKDEAQKLENTLKDRENALQHQRNIAENAERSARSLKASRDELQQKVGDLEKKLKQERANVRQAKDEAQKLENTLKDRENALQHQRNIAENAERSARSLRASRDELQQRANRLEQDADNLRRSVAELQRSRNTLVYVLAAAVIFIAIHFMFFSGNEKSVTTASNKTSSSTAAPKASHPTGTTTASTDKQYSAKHPSATLTVETSPAGARVFVHGRQLGMSPVTLKNLSPGTVNLEVRLAGYKPESRSITLRAGYTSKIKISLTRIESKGRLYVSTEPSDARVRILNIRPRYHDGIELKPGSYHIEVSKKGYQTYKHWVRLNKGQDLRMQVGLKPATIKTVAAVSRPDGKTWIDPVTGMEFVWVPGGCYAMGCGSWQSDCDDDEKPVHEVCVDGFWIGKYEVTQGQWKRIMYSNPSIFDRDDNYPVDKVSWEDVQEFIEKLNSRSNRQFRLPTEAEWEYACRSGGKKEKYCGGNDIDQVAWYENNSGGHTHPVGTKAPNGLGIYDMSGNVWEWCQDWYDGNYYSTSPRNNSQGPSFGSDRMDRGGCWGSSPGFVRSANRDWSRPSVRISLLGFRLALSPGQASK